MAFSNKDKNTEQTQGNRDQKQGPSGQGGPSVFSMPNSLMIGIFSGDGENSNTSSTIFREMYLSNSQYLSAEKEADQLSTGIHGTDPNSVRREMSERLNADLSGIRFHSDIYSETKAAQMGARAWTSGRDVYFGKGGFEPRIAAHELVHTVQQGAAKGTVTRSIAPGTVQMWPWSRRSEYDDDRTPEERADTLFRIQAGFSASDEREKAEREQKYANTYEREMERYDRLNRGRDLPQGKEERDRKAARSSSKYAAANLRVKRKNYVSKDDQRNFDAKIAGITKDTYNELKRRKEEAAKALVQYFSYISGQNNESVPKNKYLAAVSNFGKNYEIYSKLIQRIETNHPTWADKPKNEENDYNDPIVSADRIIREGNSADNAYMQSAEGIRQRAKDSKANKSYYKKIYAKKKTKLDRMAAEYRRNPEGSNLINIDDIDNSDLQDDNSSLSDLIFTGAVKGKNENNILPAGNSQNDNIVLPAGKSQKSGVNHQKGSKKNAEDIDTSAKKKGNQGNIISLIISEEEEENKENNISTEAVKNGIKAYIGSDHGGMKENNDSDLLSQDDQDPNQIIRQQSMISEELIDQFAPASQTMGSLKSKTGKSTFVNNIVKDLGGISQLAMAGYNRQLLNPSYKDPVSTSISAGSGVVGALAGLSGTITGTADTIRNIRNIKSGASHADWITSGLDTLGSGGAMVAGGLTAMKNAGSVPYVGDILVNAGSFGGENLVPGLNVATGAVNMVTGAIEGIRGGLGVRTIKNQIKALNGMNEGAQTEDQKKLLQIFKQGKRIAELHRTGGIIKSVGGGVAMATGIAVLASGPLAPITAAVLGIAGAAAGIANFVYGRRKKKNIRKIATAEEMGFTDWKEEIQKVKSRFSREGLSDSEAKEIILKSHGYDAKTRTEALKQINMKRAKMLLDVAKAGGKLGALAQKVVSALGVHRKNGRYASGAEKLLAEKLSG